MPSGETVLLVHGLWMHGVAMRLMQRRLEQRGHTVRTYSYPTVRLSLRDNAARLAHYCDTLTCDRLHLVGHSMGGLVALKAAEHLPHAKRGRIVMIGTPFADSHCGRRLERFPAGRYLLGKCMAEWLRQTEHDALPGLDIGVIAGDGGFGMGRVVARDLPKPHDGVIVVAETRVPGMRDHVTLPVSHTAMLLSREVVQQVCAYLRRGHFERASKITA
ncbi:MAG TPA: alpha/beta hydrolase [Burkholderiales bacterium]